MAKIHIFGHGIWVWGIFVSEAYIGYVIYVDNLENIHRILSIHLAILYFNSLRPSDAYMRC